MSNEIITIEAEHEEVPKKLDLLRPITTPEHMFKARQEVENIIRKNLLDAQDYGKIGTSKTPSLFKAGAEKICAAFGAYPKYTILDKEVDHDRENTYTPYRGGPQTSFGFYRYVTACSIVTRDGQELGSSIGSCSTMESKYISRPRDMENTVLKMAQKRAFVAATLNTFGLSNIFTQDLEDITPEPATNSATVQAEAKPRLDAKFNNHDSQARSQLKTYMQQVGIPDDKFEELAKSFDGRPKTDVFKLITELAKEYKND